jgi:hypothetical protein
MIEGIKVFGERGAGNNYIMHLLDVNFTLRYTTRTPLINKAMGWTHGTPPPYLGSQEKILFVCIVKNPYSWLLSFKNKPHTEIRRKYFRMNFSRYIEYPVEKEANPMGLWNLKNKSYIDLENKIKNYFLVKYEDVLGKPRAVMGEIFRKFNLTKSGQFFSPIIRETHASGKLKHEFFDRKEYYLKEKWKEKITKKDIDFINLHLDKDVMLRLNYKYL